MKARIFVVAVALAFAGATAAQTLNVVTAGDQNMVDYVNNYLAPKFEAMNPGVKVRAVGTGPGDGGSQKIYEKLSAQQKAGSNEWDIDVAVIHQFRQGIIAASLDPKQPRCTIAGMEITGAVRRQDGITRCDGRAIRAQP